MGSNVGDVADDRRLRDGVSGFDVAAAHYEAGRPGYPPEAVALLCHRLGIGPGRRVCDLAAGTGKLTGLLVDTGAEVVAVEPVAGMRLRLAEALSEVTVLDGTAEAIPLADESVDVVTVAQAFHWFDEVAAMAEIRRVLAPGGGLAVVFNERDETEPWIAALSKVVRWHQHRISQYQAIDWGEVIGAEGEAALSWEQPMTRRMLEARVRSISYVALMDEAEQRRLVTQTLALVDGFAEPFPMPYITRMWWGRPGR